MDSTVVTQEFHATTTGNLKLDTSKKISTVSFHQMVEVWAKTKMVQSQISGKEIAKISLNTLKFHCNFKYHP